MSKHIIILSAAITILIGIAGYIMLQATDNPSTPSNQTLTNPSTEKPKPLEEFESYEMKNCQPASCADGLHYIMRGDPESCLYPNAVMECPNILHPDTASASDVAQMMTQTYTNKLYSYAISYPSYYLQSGTGYKYHPSGLVPAADSPDYQSYAYQVMFEPHPHFGEDYPYVFMLIEAGEDGTEFRREGCRSLSDCLESAANPIEIFGVQVNGVRADRTSLSGPSNRLEETFEFQGNGKHWFVGIFYTNPTPEYERVHGWMMREMLKTLK